MRRQFVFFCVLVVLTVAQDNEEENYDALRIIKRMAEGYERLTGRHSRFLLMGQQYVDLYRRPAGAYEQQQSPYNPSVEDYDFVVVGSGSSGSALASRLSENPNWRILLLEVGKEANIVTDIPAIVAAFQFTDYNWGYLMEKQDNVALGLVDQRMAWPRGRGLGGTSNINYMINVRGNKKDYNRWAAMGNPGWSYEEVLPYFKKMEDARLAYQDPGYHGTDGPLPVEDVSFRTEAVNAFINSAMEAGHRYVDYNGKRQMGISYAQANTRRGIRCSAECAYLRNVRGRPNLSISTLSRATKLLLDGNKQVVGVEYVKNRQYHTARVKKEVILSAGTFNSPQLLMLSGIGPKQHLEELGIPVIDDLPVGQLMYDHATFLGITITLNGTMMTLDQSELENPLNLLRLVKNGTGPLTSIGGAEALLYIQTHISRERKKYPDLELIVVGGSMATDNGLVYRRTFRITDEIYNEIWKPLEGKQAFSIIPMLVHPYSKGNLKLKSRNPYHWPKLYGNFLTDSENLDVKTFIAGIREVQRIIQQPTLQRFGATLVRTPIPGCRHLLYDSDEYWECAIRHLLGTLHHQVATNKMGPPNDPEAVVDHKLKVYGVKGLRVADCSVIPLPLTAHTHIPAVMVGEKAADIIKEEWGAVTYMTQIVPRSSGRFSSDYEYDDDYDYDS